MTSSVTRFDIQKFDGKISFSIWRVQMKDVLTQNGLKKALEGRSKMLTTMMDMQWSDLDEKALSAIQLCLSNELLREVVMQGTLGCRYIAEGGVLRIIKGSLVVMKANRSAGSLYIVQGSSVTGTSTVSSVTSSATSQALSPVIDSSSSKLDHDLTTLWHMHLGNRTLLERVRCMLSNAGLWNKGHLWAESASTACYLQNSAVVSSSSIGDSEGASGKVELEVPTRPPSVEVTRTTTQTGPSNDQDRPRRQTRMPSKYDDYECDLVAYALNVVESIDQSSDPSSYSEAISSPDSSKWLFAMNEEIQSLHKNGTWDLGELLKDKRPLICKWIYKPTDGIPGVEEARHKVRLVVRGCHQKEEQLDVKTALLQGDLEEEIYMRQPEGFVVPGKEHLVCHLKKSLYGLKQAPRQWYKRFDSFLVSLGYSRSKFDDCVYFGKFNGSYVFLLLYVNDMLIASHDKSLVSRLKVQHSKEFDMKDLGEARKILGMEIHRDRQIGKLYLSQKKYLAKVLDRFSMNDSKPVSTPLASHFKFSEDQCPKTEDRMEQMYNVPYSNAVGSLMYAMVCTRPDLTHAISVVSRCMHNPGNDHWNAVKWILRYVKGTSDFGLVFNASKASSEIIIGYVDSDYGGDLDHRKSLSSYIFTISGCAVSWKSSLQSVAAPSTTETEYIAATEGVKEPIWLRGLVLELGLSQEVLSVFCDNQCAIDLSKNNRYHERTKHIDVKHHFIRDAVAAGEVVIHKIHTTENHADMHTKIIPLHKFKQCLSLIGLNSLK